MSAHGRALVLPVAAVAAYFTIAGTALAGTSSISGTVPNGGCDAARPVSVSGPSRIEVEVSSTAPTNNVFGVVVAPDGRTVATGTYDTPSGGSYSVRVCSLAEGMNPEQIQYAGLLGTGPAGQAAIPRTQADQGQVLGATTKLNNRVSGKGAILTRAGLAWFTARTAPNGTANVTIFDPVDHKRTLVKGMNAVFGASSVRITGNGLKLVLIDNGTSQRITFNSNRFKASGKVVRGGFQISV